MTHLKNLSIQANFLQALFPAKCQHSFPRKMQGLCIVMELINMLVSVKKTLYNSVAYPDFQITGAGRRSQKKFFRPSPQFGLKIRGKDPSPPGPSPGSATAVEPLTLGYPWGTDKWPLKRGSSNIFSKAWD